MIGIPVDMDLAAAGYLRSFDGRRINYVRDLDLIARDTLSAGVRVLWVPRATNRPAWYSHEHRVICLAPWLFYTVAPFFRDCWLHELGHAIVGRDDETARTWQHRLYQSIVLPAWLAA